MSLPQPGQKLTPEEYQSAVAEWLADPRTIAAIEAAYRLQAEQIEDAVANALGLQAHLMAAASAASIEQGIRAGVRAQGHAVTLAISDAIQTAVDEAQSKP